MNKYLEKVNVMIHRSNETYDNVGEPWNFVGFMALAALVFALFSSPWSFVLFVLMVIWRAYPHFVKDSEL